MSNVYRARIQRRLKVEGPLPVRIFGPVIKGAEISFRLLNEDGSAVEGSEEEQGVVWEGPDQDTGILLVPRTGQF